MSTRPRPTPADLLNGASPRVLVVDDDPDCMSTMAELLLIHGCRVRTAGTGLDAMNAVREFKPEVVLLDLSLNGTSGYEVAHAIRADPSNNDVFIAAVTGHGMARDRRRSAATGIDRHLVKPVEFAAIIDILRQPTRTARVGYQLSFPDF